MKRVHGKVEWEKKERKEDILDLPKGCLIPLGAPEPHQK